MEFEQILRLVEAVADSGLTEFDFEEGNLKLHLGKKSPKIIQMNGSDMNFQGASTADIERLDNELPIAGAVSLENRVSSEAAAKKPAGTPVVSPIVGVFYAAPGPEEEPFVKVGERIEAGQVIGIVEAMKLMNEIESDVSGVVTDICVQNGDGVEYGQTLIYVQE